MSWVKTASGRRIDFLSPDPDQIDIRDISLALSRNHRFAGHSPLKVGQHIHEVAALMLDSASKDGVTDLKTLAEIALVGLIHDFPEFVMCDAATPLKRLINPAYSEIEDRLLDVMLVKWDLKKVYQKHLDRLKSADQKAVEQEAIRFRMDGYFLSEDLQDDGAYFGGSSVPNEWVPPQDIILSNLVWDALFTEITLTVNFARFMILSGRSMFLPAWVKTSMDRKFEFAELKDPDQNVPDIIIGAQRSIL